MRSRAITRRALLERGAASALGLTALGSLLAGCSNTTLVGGGGNPALAPGNLPLGRPDDPVTLPLSDTNRAIASGLQPEKGPLRLYNWTEYINPKVVKAFEKKYGVDVDISTFGTLDEAVGKLASDAVSFDVFVPTLPFMAQLVAGDIIQPLNHSYIPNLKANVWPALADPWYDRGSRYTVPYTIYSTGIGWRKDKLPGFDPDKLANPYSAFWQAKDIAGRVALLDDERDALSLALLHNGVTDINTDDQADIDGARDALKQLVDDVNLKFFTNDYQQLADASIWLHQAWSGDIAAISYYLPEGTSPKQIGFWWQRDRRGMISNDCFTVLRSATSPVLAHLFLNHMLDEKVAVKNFTFTGYQQPLTGFTPEVAIETEVVPPNLSSTILRQEQFDGGYVAASLSAQGLNRWQDAWAEVKTS